MLPKCDSIEKLPYPSEVNSLREWRLLLVSSQLGSYLKEGKSSLRPYCEIIVVQLLDFEDGRKRACSGGLEPPFGGHSRYRRLVFSLIFTLKALNPIDNVLKSFVCYCNQLVGLFQVSRQQTGLVQRLSGVLWFLRVYEEDGETASIALYDFIWHCQQRLLNRPLQLVVVFR